MKSGNGAAEGTRTPDPIITNDVLYQLSYTGIFHVLLGTGRGGVKASVAGKPWRCVTVALIPPRCRAV